MEILVLAFVIMLVAFFSFKSLFSRVVILEYEQHVKFTKGKFQTVLGPGTYWINRYTTRLSRFDMRQKILTVPGQEILTRDAMPLKISLSAKYEIADPSIVALKIENMYELLYAELQLALREIIGAEEVDEVIAGKVSFSASLKERLTKTLSEAGINLLSVDIKDIMFPGEMKKVFAQAIKARKEGQAILEKARGETAALRNLANSASLLEKHPSLLQLRLMQSLNESTGNTFIIGMQGQLLPLNMQASGKTIQRSQVQGDQEGTENTEN